MSRDIKTALSNVTKKLKSLPKEDFRNLLRQHSEGEIAIALKELMRFSAVFTFYKFTLHIARETVDVNFLSIDYSSKDICTVAANDDTYSYALAG